MAELKDPEFYHELRATFAPYKQVPIFSPWEKWGRFGQIFNRSGAHNNYQAFFIYQCLEQALRVSGPDYEIWELGVYRGDSAAFLGSACEATGRTLRLFDTFEGMPDTDHSKDLHRRGDFADTSLEYVRARMKSFDVEVNFHKGLVPQTFAGLEHSKISFAHIDLDIYEAIKAAVEFIFPRLTIGGALVFDDYGWSSCPGAREAVDDYFRGRAEQVFCLPTGQSFVIKIR